VAAQQARVIEPFTDGCYAIFRAFTQTYIPMKTHFGSFIGGVFVTIVVSTVLTAWNTPNKQSPGMAARFVGSSGNNEKEVFTGVPIDTFYMNVARYKGTYVDCIKQKMPQNSERAALLGEQQEPARMFLYDLNTLERFLTIIRQCGQEVGLGDNKLAIRFYYAVYPRTMSVAGEDYGSQHTLYMTPNVWSDKYKRYVDVSIRTLARYVQDNPSVHPIRNRPVADSLIEKFYFENLITKHSKPKVFVLDASAVTFTGKQPVYHGSFLPLPGEAGLPVINQGQLCPPNCPPTSLLDNIDSHYQVGWISTTTDLHE